MSSLSFTGGRSVRYPAPDVARGFMLLLIALANVPYWLRYFPASPDGPSSADRWWILIRTALVDRRGYPLFALLFGFGVATMVRRRIERDVEAAHQSVDPQVRASWAPHVAAPWEALVRQEAVDDAARLARRRGWWMILFGFVHGIVFAGDIIGAYGIVAVLFAGVVARKRNVWMAVWGCAIGLVSACSLTGVGFWKAGLGDLGSVVHPHASLSVYYVPNSIVQWAMAALITVLISMVVPAFMIGARLGQTDILSRPDRHRGLLWAVAGAGMLIGVVGALPYGLGASGMALPVPAWSVVLFHVSGIAGACAWLALFALFAGVGEPRGIRRVLAAVGKRSMTAYLSQTILFAVLLGGMGLAGVPAVPDAWGAVIAAFVWVATLVLCFGLETVGFPRGPFEVLLRRAVARSAGPRAGVPVPPPGAGVVEAPPGVAFPPPGARMAPPQGPQPPAAGTQGGPQSPEGAQSGPPGPSEGEGPAGPGAERGVVGGGTGGE